LFNIQTRNERKKKGAGQSEDCAMDISMLIERHIENFWKKDEEIPPFPKYYK
jgi:hypothetical protein